jgi:hypothetical protein
MPQRQARVRRRWIPPRAAKCILHAQPALGGIRHMGGGASTAGGKSAKKLFKELDKDKSGSLSAHELVAAAQQYGNEMEAEWSDELVEQMLIRFDANSDGSLCIGEFEHALKELTKTHPGKKKKGKKAKAGKNTGGDMSSAVKANVAHADIVDRLADEHSRKPKEMLTAVAPRGSG